MLKFDNIEKQLPDGSWVERVNHLEQPPEENYTDMIAGFFDGNLLNKENIRHIIIDVLEFAESESDYFGIAEKKEVECEVKQEIKEEDEEIHFTISFCFVFQRIAETIV